MQQREHQAREPGPVALPGRVHEVHITTTLLLLRLAVLDDATQLLRQRARQPRAPHRLQPLPRRRRLAFPSCSWTTPLLPAAGKVNTNLVKQELSRVNMQGQRPPHRLIVRPHGAERAKEVRLPAAQEQQLIKQVESRRRRLVNTRHDDQIIPPRHGPQVPHHLQAGSRVEPGGRLVEEKHPRASHELRAHARPPPLAPRHAAPHGRADQRGRLVPQPERRQDVVDAGGALARGQAGCEARREGEGLADRQGPDQGVLLLHEAAQAAERRGRGGGAVDADGACRLGALAGRLCGFACDVCCGGSGCGCGCGLAAREDVEEGRLAAPGRPHQSEDLARLDVALDVVQQGLGLLRLAVRDGDGDARPRDVVHRRVPEEVGAVAAAAAGLFFYVRVRVVGQHLGG